MKSQILAMEVELTKVVKDQVENSVQISDTKVTGVAMVAFLLVENKSVAYRIVLGN